MTLYWDHPYHTWFFIAGSDSLPLWYKQSWDIFSKSAEDTIKSCRKRPSLKSFQYKSSIQDYSRFGRLVWSKDSFAKWVHTDTTYRNILDMQAWAPSQSICKKEGSPPDFFLSIDNRGFSYNAIPEETYHSIVVLALKTDKFPKKNVLATTLLNITQPALSGYKERPWARKSTFVKGYYEEAVDDIGRIGLLKSGNWKLQPLNAESLEEKWEKISS